MEPRAIIINIFSQANTKNFIILNFSFTEIGRYSMHVSVTETVNALTASHAYSGIVYGARKKFWFPGGKQVEYPTRDGYWTVDPGRVQDTHSGDLWNIMAATLFVISDTIFQKFYPEGEYDRFKSCKHTHTSSVYEMWERVLWTQLMWPLLFR